MIYSIPPAIAVLAVIGAVAIVIVVFVFIWAFGRWDER